MRSSGPVSTLVLALALMRAMSWTGTGSIMSISPESSAATRVASDLIVWKITSVRLCSGLPHQFGLGLKTVLHARLVALDRERPGAVGLEREGAELRGAGLDLGRAVGFRPRLREDVPGVPLVVQDGVGCREDEIDGVIVDLDDLRSGRDAALDVRFRRQRALGREDHVVGGEGLAAMELHALAQMEAPSRRLDDLPAFGEAGDDLQILVALGQAFHHVAERAEREASRSACRDRGR